MQLNLKLRTSVWNCVKIKMNKRGDVHDKDRVGSMNQSEDALIKIMINIMEIQEEPEYIDDLKEWVRSAGVDVVFHKVIKMYSLSLH